MAQKSDSLTSVEESTHRQRRWGCTCGCLTFLVALVVGSLAIIYFALKPFPLQKADRWLCSETTGFGIARFSSADSGMSDLLNFLARRIQMRWEADLAPRDRQALHSILTLARQSTDWVIYPPVYVYLERPQGRSSTPRFAVVAQFRHFFGYLLYRMAMQTLGLTPVAETPYYVKYRLGASEGAESPVLVVSHVRSVLSNDATLAETVSRADAPRRSGTPSDRFMTYYGDLNTEQAKAGVDLTFTIVNENQALSRLLQDVLSMFQLQDVWETIQDTLTKHNMSLDDVQGAVVAVDVVSADRMTCALNLYADQAPVVRKLGEVGKLLEGLPAPSTRETSGVATHIRSQVGRNSVEFTLDISGMRNVIAAWIDRSGRDTKAPSSRPQPSNENAPSQP
jgi:hypothetical protein